METSIPDVFHYGDYVVGELPDGVQFLGVMIDNRVVKRGDIARIKPMGGERCVAMQAEIVKRPTPAFAMGSSVYVKTQDGTIASGIIKGRPYPFDWDGFVW